MMLKRIYTLLLTNGMRQPLLLLLLLTGMQMRAQIQIGGSIYGGGNEGKVSGNSTVTLRAGNLNSVFGGARMADVGGRAFVHIDGEHASDYILANYVYGGNDISGKIGTSATTPTELTKASDNGIDATWNAFVRISTKTEMVSNKEEEVANAKKIYIGQLFGGGNGAYDYENDYPSLTKPVLDKTYLEILGGSIVYAYGGGNNATVEKNTVICLDNPSKVVNSIKDTRITTEGGGELLTNERFTDGMGVSIALSYPSSDEYQIGRFFGGNNQAPMDIRPTWYLNRGKVRDLYSGGNAGAMTYREGLMLIISSPDMTIDNVYGGCRMADVNPYKYDMPRMDGTFNGVAYHFPQGYAARLLITGGDINNVYGGNDISGTVYGGNAVGIHSKVNGDIYGGGNGSYTYTDNKDLKGDPTYGDVYYDVNKILGKSEGSTFTGLESVKALNEFRPNAERVSVRLVGTEDAPLILNGSVYCGGNSATLENKTPNKEATAELKIGSYVIADNVFLGSNGENMIKSDILKLYKGSYDEKDFSKIDLANTTDKDNGKTQFDIYMDAVALSIKPSVVFDTATDGHEYDPYTTQIGSFYCGGNVGSVTTDNAIDIGFDHEVIIFDKLVGGSNNADVDVLYDDDGVTPLNAAYQGGVLGGTDADGNKLILTLSGLKIQPKRWNTEKTALVWNTISSATGNEVPSPYDNYTGESTEADVDRRLKGGNIYGGCYNSGHINGNVVINLNSSVVDRKGEYAIFDKIEENEGEAILYNNEKSFNILERRSGVILDEQGMDVLGKALNVFGGGYGENSEIWGNTTINLVAGYTFQIFGGGEKGAIGKGVRNATTKKLEYNTYDEKYSCTINVRGAYPGTYRGDTDNSDGAEDNDDMAEAEFIYGGSFEAPIAGNTQINLGNGRVFNTFAGSCNADILGHTETYVGRQVNDDGSYGPGFPWVRDHLYGANDLGGRILGEGDDDCDFSNRVSTTANTMVYSTDMPKASAYIEYTQGRVDYIYGGCYGVYDYTDSYFSAYTHDDGTAKDGFTKPRMGHAFINFKPNTNTRNAVSKIFGAGQGYKHEKEMNEMQKSSYVLIDAPDNDNFKDMEVFGAGSYGGLGMSVSKADAAADLDNVSAVIDLVRGKIANVYGASWNEGVTRRTVVNVPDGSTINVSNIFGGAYGADPLIPCDVYEAHVNYGSEAATVRGGNIYGGNNAADRTLYGQVNVSKPVWKDRDAGKLAVVYGAGYGKDSWSQYTEVNLNDGAKVGYVYGGGFDGKVLNLETVNKWKEVDPDLDLTLGSDYVDYGLDIPDDDPDAYLVKKNPLGTKTNTNVYINKGATVGAITVSAEGQKNIIDGYAYGGGKGGDAIVSGTTYIGLHGGVVGKDIYGAGDGGSVLDERGVAKDDDETNDFIAQTNAYIEGGTLRKVFGGGYQGHVGKHTGEEVDGKFVAVAGNVLDDIPGETNVVIGIRKDQVFPDDYEFYNYDSNNRGDSLTYYKGVPAIQWNAYGAGEGGSVFGTSHLTFNNGYVGYDYKGLDEHGHEVYEPKLDNETVSGTAGIGQLKDYGSVFGAGYDDKSSSDFTDIKVWGGVIRGSLYGGGEISTVGRGRAENFTGVDRQVTEIYLPGGTHIEMYNGHVQRHVFGGGKGYNLYGYGGTNELYTDGYVFGKTEVYIHGGQVGTTEGLAEGYGNVFGGGDVGFVYGTGYFDQYTAAEKADNPKGSTGSPDHWYYYGSYQCHTAYGPYKVGDIISSRAFGNMGTEEKEYWTEGKYLTEDCKVVVAPYLQKRTDGSETIGDHEYNKYDYVITDDLNKLAKTKSDGAWSGDWTKLYTGDKLASGEVNPNDPVERGVHICNAVFAGGNVSSNSDQTYSNAKTVFGNTTATLYDVYHRDFITVGTEHIGGLYGGGNLSLVDGYRELNITNYGTDYYAMNTQISYEEYQTLTNRERAYFKLEYEWISAADQITFENGDTYDKPTSSTGRISEDDYLALLEKYSSEADQTKIKDAFKPWGFCSIYAGRLLNTIQRTDFCGVYGSRLVLQGAKDRVATDENTSNAASVYTINRVGELSLNQQRSVVPGETTGNDALHGNYFGIYSVVNYLGHLTSDVKFEDTYTKYDDGQAVTVPGYTYYSWKKERLKNRDRNNGTCVNQVALASGVFLEVTTEYSTKTNKIYGDITGIVELDLINVKKDIEGGGYVYARNEHGARTYHSDYVNVILSEYNKPKTVEGVTLRDEARTYKRYTYSTTELLDHETSGNFIHKKKRIIDDCYPHNGVYNDLYKQSPAHYWYIKGEVYIYDREVTAYAGSATAYSKDVNLPLTISAASEGKLQLLNVQPNLYAYWADKERSAKIGEDGVLVNNETETYYLNDVITWWDWNQLPSDEQKYFVKDTYVNVDSCTIDGISYKAGTYVLAAMPTTTTFGTVTDSKGENVNTAEGISNLFRSSNNISHGKGYVLTFDMDSPKDWDDWYSKLLDTTSGDDKVSKETYNNGTTVKDDYIEGPTYRLKEGQSGGLYGQRTYDAGEILSKEVYEDYTNTVGSMASSYTDQAEVERAYVAKVSYDNIVAGYPISVTAYGNLSAAVQANYETAMVCTNTIQLGDNDFILLGDLVAVDKDSNGELTATGLAELQAIADKYMTYNNGKQNADPVTEDEALEYVKSCLSDAYYCTVGGKYGGQYFKSGQNYSAIKSWCSLSEEDREKFDFNYDAFDVLVDPSYPGEGNTDVYDANGQTLYSAVEPMEYTAVYSGNLPFTYHENNNNTTHTIQASATTEQKTISREDFEKILNEQRNYTSITVPKGSAQYTAYIATKTFIDGGIPVAEGENITEKFSSLSKNVREDTSGTYRKEVTLANTDTQNNVVVYYCYKDYTPATTTITPQSGTLGSTGSVISSADFSNLQNDQKNFVIQGKEPTGTITLYVSGQSQPKDVLSEKIITVVYQYTYYESDEDSEGTSLVNELHVLNIHLKLESGVPEIGPLSTPPTVLPGTTVGLKTPSVNPGLYEPISNGWEMYSSSMDADMHRNGEPFSNNGTRLYWYQNQKVWVAYYTKTILGYTYSNPVQISVANYHDLDDVMKDKDHHMYVDCPDVLRPSKIYIDNRTCESNSAMSELDLLKDFFDLSVTGATNGHAALDNYVKGCANLDFILNSDVSPKAYANNWTPIGTASQCFEGTLHGDGYTVSGLDHSLFDYLCGSVYNLGVTGSFSSAGVVDHGAGYVENCWINTTGTPDGSVRAVFGDPTRGSGTQIVNCYYQDTKNYSTTDNGRGLARAMSDQEFYNGTVAYNLNNFYLNRRYYNGIGQTETTKWYYCLPVNKADNTLPENLSICYYPESPDAKYGNVGYVESRYANEDFIYAGGRIPDGIDIHQRSVTSGDNTAIRYAPIWPDDYLFFGQRLNYGYGTESHDAHPTHLIKVNERVPQSESSNRVYRAPAYFQSSALDVAHFNLKAYLAAYSASTSITDTDRRPAYPNMTAIDFAGHQEGTGSGAFEQDYHGKLFYQPLLDDDGLISVSNNGETKNLLVYAPSDEANQKTNTVLNAYFANEPTFGFNEDNMFQSDDTPENYHRVAVAETGEMVGHLVQATLTNGMPTATTDHLLVDKQDFDCPISYTMASGKRMWYQRTPDNSKFVTLASGETKGWDAVSLPFEVQKVTTQQKGEISHFYTGSTTGHEYWLRQFAGNVKQKKDENGLNVAGVFTADFNSMDARAATDENEYNYGNTFLWDYYYSKNPNDNVYGDDANADDYKQYYNGSHSHAGYPLQQPGTAYLIGFPGASYYEFDLSGQWTASHTATPAPAQLNKQTVTFISATGITIRVSDNEKEGTEISSNKFQPNYLTKKLEDHDYLLNNDGNSFDKASATSTTVPFRPYLYVVNTSGSSPTRNGAQKDSVNHVVFGGDVPEMKLASKPISSLEDPGNLIVKGGKKKITVESQLRYTVDVRIVTPAGITLSTYSIEPGEVVETRVQSPGVYIVEGENGKYIKKVIVR
ncbi:MAG: hypothetical protein IJJ56_08140 [Prevotella sp.]|nr:hypothetical protein [Prevotella sp.]